MIIMTIILQVWFEEFCGKVWLCFDLWLNCLFIKLLSSILGKLLLLPFGLDLTLIGLI